MFTGIFNFRELLCCYTNHALPKTNYALLYLPTWVSLNLEKSLLPLKEVIQPHLPVRLPCYDLVPVIDPTLGVCFPYGLARRLKVLSTSIT